MYKDNQVIAPGIKTSDKVTLKEYPLVCEPPFITIGLNKLEIFDQ